MSEKTKTCVVMLKRSQLHPHPDNPRKDLGDLEELRASIQERDGHGSRNDAEALRDLPDTYTDRDTFTYTNKHTDADTDSGTNTDLSHD